MGDDSRKGELFPEEIVGLSVASGFQYFQAMEEALGADTRRYMDECLSLKSKGHADGLISQESYAELGFLYRGLARALLTYVEGILYVMRRLTIDAEARGEVKLMPAEAALLREEAYSVNVHRKRVQVKSSTNRFLENFVLTFDLFPQVLGSTFGIDYGGQGWEQMQLLVKLRNDITHPKGVEDTLLAPEMPNLIRDTAVWFFGCMKDLVSSVDTHLLDRSMRETARMPELRRLLEERGKDREA